MCGTYRILDRPRDQGSLAFAVIFPLFQKLERLIRVGNCKRYSALHCMVNGSRLSPFMTQQSRANLAVVRLCSQIRPLAFLDEANKAARYAKGQQQSR
jgi:hypothetical protein